MFRNKYDNIKSCNLHNSQNNYNLISSDCCTIGEGILTSIEIVQKFVISQVVLQFKDAYKNSWRSQFCIIPNTNQIIRPCSLHCCLHLVYIC